jgi:hypothetical protein
MDGEGRILLRAEAEEEIKGVGFPKKLPKA